MATNGLVKKSYSIAYAAFRLAGFSGNAAIRQPIEEGAMRILAAALKDDVLAAKNAAKLLEHLLAFGRDVGVLDAYGAELIFAEMEAFRKFPEEAREDKKPLSKEDLFPPVQEEGNIDVVLSWFEGSKESGNHNAANNPAMNNPAIAELAHGPAIILNGAKRNGSEEEPFLMRKEKIMARIRQSGNCRVKDVQEAMPGISERTLRYDLQRLVQDGIIERVGPGGPGTYYRVKA